MKKLQKQIQNAFNDKASVTINKSDYSQVKGKVVKVSEQSIMLDLSKGIIGVETNVWLTIIDKNGIEHLGTLFVTHHK